VTLLALAWGTGTGLSLAGLPLAPALLMAGLAVVPLLPWHRPRAAASRSRRSGPGKPDPNRRPSRRALPFSLPGALLLALMGGLLSGAATVRSQGEDCRLRLEGRLEVEGRFQTRVEPGRTAPFRVEAGLPECGVTVLRVRWPAGAPVPPTGTRMEVAGRWEGRSFPEPGRALWAGRLLIEGSSGEEAAADPFRSLAGGDLPGRVLRVRGMVQDRIHHLWEDRAPMVEALVLARREGLDPGLRDAFGLSGTAHLLAISGFHVGVVAGLLLGLLRLAGFRPRAAAVGAAGGSWLYVLAIGAPDAALRAAVLLTLLAAARLRGRPPMSVGTLSTAFLLLLLWDPGGLASVGFQLSFAGTLGLVVLRRPLEDWVQGLRVRAGLRPLRRGPAASTGDRWLRAGSEGFVAGVAATLPTLPLLAWHFDRVSLVGIPATLLVSPVVALAIPGIGASLGLSTLVQGLGGFLAGGVGLLLAGVEMGVRGAAGLPGASVWVSRPALLGGGATGVLALVLLHRTRAGRIRAGTRRGMAVLLGASATVLLPLLPGPRVLELHMIDVGQGDALAIRLPGGGWIGVDAGPSGPGWDAGARRVVPYLRRQGARRLEALVLTHAHLDHVGGAAAVLRQLPVRGVMDPSRVTASVAWLEALQEARARRVSWWPAEAGREVRRDGVTIRVLHPPLHPGGRTGIGVIPSEDEGPGTDPNQVSVVLLVTWEGASLLLTGDAYAPVEEAVLDHIPPLTVLKAGHHGSRTSTGQRLLEATRPSLTQIPVGDGNRYGHPHPEVLSRLEASGSQVWRTDRDGDIRVRIRPGGRWEVRAGRR
jgi:competence protein ComEC